MLLFEPMVPAAKDDNIDIHRRRLLSRGLRWGGTIITGLLVYPFLRFTGYRVKPKPRYVSVPAPLPINKYHADRDFILFHLHEKPHAISRKCTHLGCRVSYLEDKQIIECPCHQSQFTPEGTFISGPAGNKNLPTYAVSMQEDQDGKITGYTVTL